VAIEVTMPQMGADMTEGTLVRWVKHEGDQVNRGDIIAEIETDKATVELEAFESGIIRKQVVGEGETVPVGQVIALLGTSDEPLPEVERKPPAQAGDRRSSGAHEAAPTAATATAERPAEVVENADTLNAQAEAPAEGPRTSAPATQQEDGRVRVGDGAPQAPAGEQRVRISPVARRIAEERHLDLAAIKGSGPDGRILRRDVEAALGAPPAAEAEAAAPSPARAPAPAPEPAPAAPSEPARAAPTAGAQPLSRMRQAIARRMTQAKQQQPHYYLTLDVDMTEALAFREQLNAASPEDARVTINDLVVKACALALAEHPKFNAEFGEEGLRFHDRINIAVGVAMDEGLIAPALLDCGSKSLGAIARQAKDLVERTKGGRLRTEEYGSGTFTITNLGAYGVEMLIGIINPPQAAILGVGSVMAKPVARDGEVVIRQVMKVALSADHRVTDGAEGARFIKEIQGLLESPVRLAL
jgi:pyruvate dehydrogenase E2 component (dihydrolipoamide acetyltransferase)